MRTYYQILGVAPTATQQEIKSALSLRYHRCRELTRNQNAKVAHRAKRALRQLEAISDILLDPQQRAAYDARLDGDALKGGLADPQAKRVVGALQGGKGQKRGEVVAVSAPRSPWMCTECHSPNPRQTRYCVKCGTQIARECPMCYENIEKISKFCGHCGVDIHMQINRAQINGLRKQLELEQRRLDFLTRRFKKAIMLSKSREESEWDYDPAEPGPVRRCFLTVLSIMFVVGVLSCGIVGHAIGKAIVPSGYGFDGHAGGGGIGATLGSSFGVGLGTITGMYVSHYLCVRKELKARKSQCTSKIAQLQNAIQSKSEQVLRGDGSDSDRMANTFDIPPYYDSRRRVAYNEQLGLRGEDDLGSSQPVTPVGASFPTSLRSHAPASSSTTPKSRVGVWICSGCGSRQSVNVRYCKQCGYQLGINCPQCDTLILSDSKFCPNCATKVQEAIQQKEFEETQRKRAQQEAARHRAQQQAEEQERAKRRERVKVQMGILGCILGAIAGPIAWAIIWPRVMASTLGVIAQIVMGAIGGVVANLWIVDSWNDPLQEKAGLGFGIIGGIVGGIVAFPVIVLGLLSQLLA